MLSNHSTKQEVKEFLAKHEFEEAIQEKFKKCNGVTLLAFSKSDLIVYCGNEEGIRLWATLRSLKSSGKLPFHFISVPKYPIVYYLVLFIIITYYKYI
jgi:hypothetical protein